MNIKLKLNESLFEAEEEQVRIEDYNSSKAVHLTPALTLDMMANLGPRRKSNQNVSAQEGFVTIMKVFQFYYELDGTPKYTDTHEEYDKWSKRRGTVIGPGIPIRYLNMLTGTPHVTDSRSGHNLIDDLMSVGLLQRYNGIVYPGEKLRDFVLGKIPATGIITTSTREEYGKKLMVGDRIANSVVIGFAPKKGSNPPEPNKKRPIVEVLINGEYDKDSGTFKTILQDYTYTLKKGGCCYGWVNPDGTNPYGCSLPKTPTSGKDFGAQKEKEFLDSMKGWVRKLDKKTTEKEWKDILDKMDINPDIFAGDSGEYDTSLDDADDSETNEPLDSDFEKRGRLATFHFDFGDSAGSERVLDTDNLDQYAPKLSVTLDDTAEPLDHEFNKGSKNKHKFNFGSNAANLDINGEGGVPSIDIQPETAPVKDEQSPNEITNHDTPNSDLSTSKKTRHKFNFGSNANLDANVENGMPSIDIPTEAEPVIHAAPNSDLPTSKKLRHKFNFGSSANNNADLDNNVTQESLKESVNLSAHTQEFIRAYRNYLGLGENDDISNELRPYEIKVVCLQLGLPVSNEIKSLFT